MVALDDLPPRQREIAVLVAHGASNREIAARTGLAPATVKNVLTRLFRRLDLTNRTALAVWGARQLLEPAPRVRLPELVHPAMSPAFAELMLTVVAELRRDVEHLIAHNQPACPRCERVTRAFAAAYHAERSAA